MFGCKTKTDASIPNPNLSKYSLQTQVWTIHSELFLIYLFSLLQWYHNMLRKRKMQQRHWPALYMPARIQPRDKLLILSSIILQLPQLHTYVLSRFEITLFLFADVNPCKTAQNNCSSFAVCTDLLNGSFNCTCLLGYQASRSNCTGKFEGGRKSKNSRGGIIFLIFTFGCRYWWMCGKYYDLYVWSSVRQYCWKLQVQQLSCWHSSFGFNLRRHYWSMLDQQRRMRLSNQMHCSKRNCNLRTMSSRSAGQWIHWVQNKYAFRCNNKSWSIYRAMRKLDMWTWGGRELRNLSLGLYPKALRYNPPHFSPIIS